MARFRAPGLCHRTCPNCAKQPALSRPGPYATSPAPDLGRRNANSPKTGVIVSPSIYKKHTGPEHAPPERRQYRRRRRLCRAPALDCASEARVVWRAAARACREAQEGGELVNDDFKQLCFGWTLAFVLVVGSILILGQFGPVRAGFPPSVRSRRSSRRLVWPSVAAGGARSGGGEPLRHPSLISR